MAHKKRPFAANFGHKKMQWAFSESWELSSKDVGHPYKAYSHCDTII
jgi:hypothetical protein